MQASALALAIRNAEGEEIMALGYPHMDHYPKRLQKLPVRCQWVSLQWLPGEFHLPSAATFCYHIETRRFHSSHSGTERGKVWRKDAQKTLKQRLINLFRCSQGKHSKPSRATGENRQQGSAKCFAASVPREAWKPVNIVESSTWACNLSDAPRCLRTRCWSPAICRRGPPRAGHDARSSFVMLAQS